MENLVEAPMSTQAKIGDAVYAKLTTREYIEWADGQIETRNNNVKGGNKS